MRCFLMARTQPCSALFPYTTLFRSPFREEKRHLPGGGLGRVRGVDRVPLLGRAVQLAHASRLRFGWIGRPDRSEEHTSELQSHSDLVCRLLLEKKKNSRGTARTLYASACV